MKKKILLSSIVTIALCLCMIVGSTFALFTSQSELDIEVTAGNVKIDANIDDILHHSVLPNVNGTVVDEFGGTYEYDHQDADNFYNGGEADFASNVLSIKRITPGDKVSFNIYGENTSDVSILMRYVIEIDTTHELVDASGNAVVHNNELAEVMVLKAGNIEYTGVSSYTSAWTLVAVGADMPTAAIELGLPVTVGNTYQNTNVEYVVRVEAIQSNANVDRSQVPTVKFVDNIGTAVSSATELQDALNTARGEHTIYLLSDIAGDLTVGQNPGTEIVISGNGYDFDGEVTVNGKSGSYPTAGVVIKDVNFVATAGNAPEAFINLGVSGDTNTRYASNVTISNCTFTYTGSYDDAPVAIKSYTGGDKNLTVENCTATGVHSLLQVKNVTNLVVNNCNVTAKNGINLNHTPSLEMSNCNFDVQGYVVRVGDSGNAPEGKTFKISDSTLKSACAESGDAVIVVRGSASKATIVLNNVTLDGTTEFYGLTADNTVVR